MAAWWQTELICPTCEAIGLVGHAPDELYRSRWYYCVACGMVCPTVLPAETDRFPGVRNQPHNHYSR